MKFGIIGSGFGYDSHFKALEKIKGVEIVGITDSGSGKVISKLSKPNIYFKSIESLIQANPNVITIATPPIHHFGLIKKLAKNNINIVCEKPFCISTKQALNSILLIEKYGLSNCINFQYRFEPGIEFLKSKLNDQIIDEIESIEVIWLTSGGNDPSRLWSWRNEKKQGGGVINDFLIHVFDLIQWLLKSEIEDIVESKSKILTPLRRADKSGLKPVTAADFVEVDLKLKDNIHAFCKVSNCCQKSTGMRITLSGKNSKLIYEHKPPFRPCDQSVFLEKNGEKTQIFNAAYSIPDFYKDTRTFSIRELYIKFISSLEGKVENDIPSFRSCYQIKKIIDKMT